MQTLALQLGGKVTASSKREYGYAKLNVITQSKLFTSLGKKTDVWMSHGDKVTKLPRGFKAIANTSNTTYAAIENTAKKFFALQFHPEVTHTKSGKKILSNFIYNICGCKKLWTTSNIVHDAVQKIQTKVGSDKVILGLSGGVDSAVTALLLHKAIGKKLICVFVDTGLLRLNEAAEVLDLFAKHFHVNVICVDAKQRFLRALNGISDPESKRKIIGKEFIEVFGQTAKKIKGY